MLISESFLLSQSTEEVSTPVCITKLMVKKEERDWLGDGATHFLTGGGKL